MKGDFSRFTFHPERHYNGVRMQQGRVQLDADWNEQVDILAHLRHTSGVDVIGASGAPRLGGGFEIGVAGDNLSISAGRIYVDGRLVENESAVWYKLQGARKAQPHYPVPTAWTPPSTGIYLVYLDVWERHITALEDAAVREVALGGPDTATRTQVVWQVRLLRVGPPSDTVTCWDIPGAWTQFVSRAHGKLAARTKPAEAAAGPCVVPASAGYRRLENQLYRVEIHDRGAAGTATFKWSRDNGMVVTRLNDINGRILTVADPGRDEVLGFATGQWIEISDDARVLRGEPGVMVRVLNVVEDTIEIEQWSEGAPDTPPPVDLATATVRRWDHVGSERAITVDPGTVADPLWIDLEDGVQVRFDSHGTYETGDYWVIPARTVSAEALGGDIEWPRDPAHPATSLLLAPRGIAHHLARLAVVAWNGSSFELQHDCRPLFPALTEPDLVYVSGDGQEAMPGERLPQPLRVAVVNCHRPVEGAWIKVAVIEGNGTLEVDTSPSGFTILEGSIGAVKAFLARTDADGELAAYWRLEELQDLEHAPDQRVQATLLTVGVDDPANYLDVPVLFGASFGVAWENQYGGSTFPDEQHESLTVITIEQALDQLRQNVALYYVSGGGQQVAPGPRDEDEDESPYAGLADPLEVRVANGDWPYAGAQVRFTIETGEGSLYPDSEPGDPASSLVVETDENGIARCYWALDRDTPGQRVNAELISAGDIDIVSPSRVGFVAWLATADHITYDGSDFPDGPHPGLAVDTVEAALDQLRENTALHYVGGDGQEVYPDAAAPRPLPQPLQVRVANGQWPRAGAQVEFSVNAGHGQLRIGAGPVATTVTAACGSHGIAQCTWIPNPNGPVSQQVTARLIAPVQLPGTPANPLPGVIKFFATLNRAIEVHYPPNNESLADPRPNTVKGAIDDLYAMKVNRAGDTITGDLTVQGNLTVNGTTTTVNTDTLEVEDNIIRVNKYAPPQVAPRVINGGMEVYRGGTVHNAQVIWDEVADHWKIGVEGELYDVAYGPDWTTLTQGHIADGLHRHRQLYAGEAAVAPAVNVDAGGNVGVGMGVTTPQARLHVNGNLRLAVGEGLEFLGDANYFGPSQDARVFRMIDNNASGGVVDGGIAVEGYTPTDNVRRPIMAIRGAGHVGIGTKNPDARLHVVATTPDIAYFDWTTPVTMVASNAGGATVVTRDLAVKTAAEESFSTIRNATQITITNNGGNGFAHLGGGGMPAFVLLYVQDAGTGNWIYVTAWQLFISGSGAGSTVYFNNQVVSFAKRDISGLRFQAYLYPNTTVTMDGWNGMRFEFQSDHDAAIFEGRVGIGTTEPAYRLDVSGTTRLNGNTLVNGTGQVTGNVGIGQAPGTERLEVTGNLRLSGRIFQEEWHAPSLLNGWVNYGNGYNPAGYFIDKNGIVHLRGLVRSGTINAGIFVLPAGYRPEFRQLHAVICGSTLGRCDILADGTVWPVQGNNAWFSLDGITFRAATGSTAPPTTIPNVTVTPGTVAIVNTPPLVTIPGMLNP